MSILIAGDVKNHRQLGFMTAPILHALFVAYCRVWERSTSQVD